jgi:hypothetical protein
MNWLIEIATREAPGNRTLVATVPGAPGPKEALISYGRDKEICGWLGEGMTFRLAARGMAVADVDDLIVVARRKARDYDAAVVVAREKELVAS